MKNVLAAICVLFSLDLHSQNTTDSCCFELTDTIFKIGQVHRMHYVLFDLDDSRIRQDTRTYLDTVVRFLKAHPELKFEIGVHFDQRYSKEHSRVLSQQRADSLLAYFYSVGVDTIGFTSFGYQGEKPLLTEENLERNLTEKDYFYNRRTELKIILKPKEIN